MAPTRRAAPALLSLALLSLAGLLAPAASAIPDEATREVGPCALTYDLRGPYQYNGASCAGVEVVGYETYVSHWGVYCALRAAGQTVYECAP